MLFPYLNVNEKMFLKYSYIKNKPKTKASSKTNLIRTVVIIRLFTFPYFFFVKNSETYLLNTVSSPKFPMMPKTKIAETKKLYSPNSWISKFLTSNTEIKKPAITDIIWLR